MKKSSNVIKVCELGLQTRALMISSQCLMYYPVLTNDEINEGHIENADFNYIEYTTDLYMDEIYGDKSLHWICKRCNKTSYSDDLSITLTFAC